MSAGCCAPTRRVLQAFLLQAFLLQVSDGAILRRRAMLLAGLRQAASDHPVDVSKVLREIDADHDGRASRKEVAAFARAMGLDATDLLQEFGSLDANHDGALDAAELADALGVPAPEPVHAHAEASAHAAAAAPRRHAAATPPKRPEVDAASFATVASGLSLGERKDAEAAALERSAAELRAEAATVGRKAAQAAQERSSSAALAKAQALFDSIEQLEERAQRTETRAAGYRARAAAELHEVRDLMAVSEEGLGASSGASSGAESPF